MPLETSLLRSSSSPLVRPGTPPASLLLYYLLRLVHSSFTHKNLRIAYLQRMGSIKRRERGGPGGEVWKVVPGGRWEARVGQEQRGAAFIFSYSGF